MLINPNHAAETWSVGDTCYFHEKYNDAIFEGTIKNIERVHGTATIHGSVTHRGTFDAPLDRLFKTHAAGMAALQASHDARQKKYEDSIQTVQDLLQFALDHPVAKAEEYTNWEARAAFIARAEALLGVDLKN